MIETLFRKSARGFEVGARLSEEGNWLWALVPASRADVAARRALEPLRQLVRQLAFDEHKKSVAHRNRSHALAALADKIQLPSLRR